MSLSNLALSYDCEFPSHLDTCPLQPSMQRILAPRKTEKSLSSISSMSLAEYSYVDNSPNTRSTLPQPPYQLTSRRLLWRSYWEENADVGDDVHLPSGQSRDLHHRPDPSRDLLQRPHHERSFCGHGLQHVLAWQLDCHEDYLLRSQRCLSAPAPFGAVIWSGYVATKPVATHPSSHRSTPEVEHRKRSPSCVAGHS